MKQYFIRLIGLSALMALLSFVPLWSKPEVFLVIMPILVIYFAIVTGVLHNFVVKSAYKDPRTFIKNFLGGTVGTMIMHLVFVMAYSFTHLESAKYFLVAFLVDYAVYLIYETVELVFFVKKNR